MVFIVSTMPPEARFFEITLRAELVFMSCLAGRDGGGSSQARRLKSSAARSAVTRVDRSFTQSGRAHTERRMMITTAWAIGGSSVKLRSSWAIMPTGVISSSRCSAPPVSRIVGLARSQIDDPEITPEHATAKSGAERLGAGFLRGKTARIAGGAIGAPIAFAAFRLSEDAVEKAVAKLLDHALDAADVDQIVAEPENHRIVPARQLLANR